MKLLKFKNYIAMIKGSVGSTAFQNNFATDDNGEEKNITEGGTLACAYFVSSILLIHGLIKSVHATVDGTLKDMKDSGWYSIETPQVGAVILWEKDLEGTGIHRHLGFYMGDNEAISNSSSEKIIALHDLDFNGKRKIEKIFWHNNLNN